MRYRYWKALLKRSDFSKLLKVAVGAIELLVKSLQKLLDQNPITGNLPAIYIP